MHIFQFEYRQHTIYIMKDFTGNQPDEIEVVHHTINNGDGLSMKSVEEAIEFINTRVTIPLIKLK